MFAWIKKLFSPKKDEKEAQIKIDNSQTEVVEASSEADYSQENDASDEGASVEE